MKEDRRTGWFPPLARKTAGADARGGAPGCLGRVAGETQVLRLREPQKARPAPLSRARIEAPIPEAELAQIAEEASQTERRAAEAERELVEWKKVRFMQDRVGEEFAALVLNPAKFGLFVELTDLFVEGLAPIDTLSGDRYTWRENTHEIIGERWGRRFRAGDRVQVILDRILAQERKLQFSIVEEGLALTGKKAAQSPSKTKKNKRRDANPRASKGKKRRQERQAALRPAGLQRRTRGQSPAT